MNIITKWTNILKKWFIRFNANKSFKDRLFYLFEITGFASSFFAFISTIQNSLSTPAILASLFCICIMVINLLFVLVTGNISMAGILCCISLNFIMFPLLFLVSGGVHSGMPFYFMLGLAVAVLILNGIKQIVVLGISILIDTLCYHYYFMNMDRLFQLSKEQEMVDIITSFWIVALFLIIVFSFLILEYEKEQKKIIIRNQELKENSQRDSLTNLYNHRFVGKNFWYYLMVIQRSRLYVMRRKSE